MTFVTLACLVACSHSNFQLSFVVGGATVAAEAVKAQWRQHTKVVTESHCFGAMMWTPSQILHDLHKDQVSHHLHCV